MKSMRLSLILLRNAFVILALIVATMQIAYARGAAPAVDQMVICTGQSAVVIGIDAEGNPTGVVHYCPDCAATALVALDIAQTTLPVPLLAASEAIRPRFLVSEYRPVIFGFGPRGPPSEV
jgi:hypothetical protein